MYYKPPLRGEEVAAHPTLNPLTKRGRFASPAGGGFAAPADDLQTNDVPFIGDGAFIDDASFVDDGRFSDFPYNDLLTVLPYNNLNNAFPYNTLGSEFPYNSSEFPYNNLISDVSLCNLINQMNVARRLGKYIDFK